MVHHKFLFSMQKFISKKKNEIFNRIGRLDDYYKKKKKEKMEIILLIIEQLN